MEKKRKRKAARVGAVVLVLLFSVVCYRFNYRVTSSDSMAFDAHLWREYHSDRYRMVDDLVESRLLKGMTREEVTALLGEGQYTHGGYADGSYSVGYYTRYDYVGDVVRGYELVVVYDRDDICIGCIAHYPTSPYG